MYLERAFGAIGYIKPISALLRHMTHGKVCGGFHTRPAELTGILMCLVSRQLP
jgi:hypothetical protein